MCTSRVCGCICMRYIRVYILTYVHSCIFSYVVFKFLYSYRYVVVYLFVCASIIDFPTLCTKARLRSLRREVGAGVETQKNVRGEIGGWGRVPFNETYAPSLSTIYDGA